MELRQLRYFLAAARHLNFTRAAREVHIAQPPFGRQIAALEAQLGTQLLKRDTRGMSLTPAGNLVAARAEEILGSIRRLEQDVAALLGSGRRRFSIGATPWLLHGRMADGIVYLRRTYPDLDVTLSVHPADELIRRVRHRELDLAVGAEPSRNPEIEQIVVREDSYALAVPIDHRLLSQAPDRCENEDVLIQIESSSTERSDRIAAALRHMGVRPSSALSTTDPGAALRLVATGVGIAVVPALARRMPIDGVAYLPLAGIVSPVLLSTLRGENSAIVAGVASELLRLETETPLYQPLLDAFTGAQGS